MLQKLKGWFAAGVLMLMPLGVTFFVIKFLLDKVGQPASALFFGRWTHVFGQQWMGWVMDILAFLIVMAIITAFGWLSKFFFGRFLLSITEKCIKAIPIINTIYKTVQQIVETIGKNKKAVFQQAVLVPFPSQGLYSIGFLTNRSTGETQSKTAEEVYNVFVPTTPNPTSGFLIMVPEAKMIRLDMSVGDAIKLIISGGTVSPETLQQKVSSEIHLEVKQK
ncbi:MAG: DUF502 domain-containing protein [Opitutales bacterium]|nr:DUF502 domain-containing protein [Opitutales bacterium]